MKRKQHRTEVENLEKVLTYHFGDIFMEIA